MSKFTPSGFLELADVASAIESVCPVGYVRVKQAAEVVDDLYAALEMFVSAGVGNSTDFMKQGDAYAEARAALAKARGEE